MRSNTKRCNRCGLVKTLDNFFIDKKGKNGHSSKCKMCTKKYLRIYEKKCLICHDYFKTPYSIVKLCSIKCTSKFNSGDNNYKWKGKEAGYDAIHKWVKRKLGSPKFCEHCKSTKAKIYHWSNISNKYKRDVTDWQRLCAKCHCQFDKKHRKIREIKCLGCGVVFKVDHSRKKYCSRVCYFKYHLINNKKK